MEKEELTERLERRKADLLKQVANIDAELSLFARLEAKN
jgi:hypothetical protein